jgi:S1-C subfamily serine protease
MIFKTKLLSTLTASAISLASMFNLYTNGSDKQYDNNSIYTTDDLPQKLSENAYKIRVRGKIKSTVFDKDKPKEVKFNPLLSSGSALLMGIDNGYLTLLTNSHVVMEAETRTQNLDFFGVGVKLQTELSNLTYQLQVPYKEHIITRDLEVLTRDKDIDYALVRTKSPLFKTDDMRINYSIGNSKELKRGDFLYVTGYPRGLSNQLGHGIVKGRTGKEKKSFPFTDIILVDYTGIPGNSGGGVFALRDGAPELVGIVQLDVGADSMGMVGLDRIKQDLKSDNLERLLK